MKNKSRTGRLISILLVVTMLMSVMSLGLSAVSAAGGATLTYDFKYANAGYAQGRITLKAGSSADYGTYNLYWANNTKALDGYAPIKTMNLNTSVNYVELGEFLAIPADATKVIAVKGSASKTVAAAAAVFDIPESKQFRNSSSEKQYDFQALSDIHIQHDDSYWVHSKAHWANALEVAAKRDAEFVAVCGDQVNGYGYSNLQKEWPQYLKILADSSFVNPVFETNGNHEIKGNGGSSAQDQDHNIYKIGSGLNIETGKMSSTTYYEKTINGDHFIFMTLEKSGSPNEYSEFSDAQLDWLEGLVKKYKDDGHKFIIFQHALIKGYGAGDDLVNPYYGGALNPEFDDVKRFMTILESNKDIIWFSGHSHIDFKYNYNFSNMDGATCYTVHIPATTSTTHPNPGTGSTDYIMSPDSSQGYFVDMYEDYVVVNGTDLVKNEILPLYTYIVDYSGNKLNENEMPTVPDIQYENVQVEVDVTALSENPSSVKVRLYGADDELLTKEVTMAKTTDGTYLANVSTQFTKMKFIVNGGSSGEYNVANCKVVLGGIKVAVNLNDIKTKEGASCTGWSAVNAYSWNSSNNQNTGEWPGTAMTKQSDGTYTILLSEGVNPNMIIFNNGSSQTADLQIDPFVVSKTEGSYTITDGSGDIATLPKETTTEDDNNDGKTELIDIYFVKPSDWANAYIYAYYGDGTNCDKEWTKPYPGNLMEYVETDNGNAIYVGQVPKDINTIKFADGSDTNRRTDIIVDFADDICFKLGASMGTNKWNVTTYDYEAPTDPTEPTTTIPVTSENTEPTSTIPATSENTEPTSTAPVDYLYGDADLDGKVTIKDATLIQKYSADIAGAELEGTAFTQANVSGDAAVNIRDATYIQKYVASLLDIFPVEETGLAAVGATASDLNTMLVNVKKILSDENYYASYIAYAKLKKAYYEYKDGASNVDTAYEAVNSALTAYNKMKQNNPNHVDAGTGSAVLPSGTTTNATSVDGLKTAPADGAYAIRGSFNNWGNSGLEYMVKGSDGKYTISYELKAGSYEFKFFNADTSSWYGNTSTMNPGDEDWTFTDTGTVNCGLNATEDGVYKFTYYYKESESKIKISVELA